MSDPPPAARPPPPMDTKPLTCALCPFASHCPQELSRHQLAHPHPESAPSRHQPLPVKPEPPAPWWPPAEPPDHGWEGEPTRPALGPDPELGYQLVVVGEGGEGEGSAGSSPGPRTGLPPPPSAPAPPPRHRWQSKQYQCDLCPYVARGKQDLRVHEREQHLREGGDVVQCNQCSYSTNKISFWRQHKLVHLGAAGGATGRIYMCKTCGWKTKYRHSLVKHIALHTGNKSFQCDQCGFACARKENLKRHKLTHLKKGVDGKGLLLKCGWCEYSTAHSNALRRHAVTLHNADENYVPEYQCDMCDYRTTKLSNFSNHKITHLYGYMMVQVNQTGPLKCSLCPFVSDHWDCLQEHQRTHKELRCVQDLLGGGESEAGPPAQPPPSEAGAPGQEEGSGGPAADPSPPDGADDMVALREIIGAIGQYVNGEGVPAAAAEEGAARRPSGGRRRRWRGPGSGGPPTLWEVGARLGAGRRFRCAHCRFTSLRREGLRRHLSSHAARRRGPGGDPPQPGPPEQPMEHPQQARPPTPPACSPHRSEPQERSSPEPREPGRAEPGDWLQREKLALERSSPEPREPGRAEPGDWLQREKLALERERLALEREKWEVQRRVLALQEQKLRLQVRLLENQVKFAKSQGQT